ncbi:hypothetical protein BT93_F1780 [Corymbia citriodora subsp. variegata]|nr:hypothetical protein BT93_F1780 [Corymbia citriodora subsp. variegata]
MGDDGPLKGSEVVVDDRKTDVIRNAGPQKMQLEVVL